MDTFIKNIQQEHCFLQGFASRPLPVPNFDNLQGYDKYISLLRQALVTNGINNLAEISETSHQGLCEYDFFHNKIKYGYQRYDLELLQKNWLSYLYNCPNDSLDSFGFFTSSGMGAICSVLFALQDTMPSVKNFQFTTLPYFETFFLIKKFFRDIDITYLDESSINTKYVAWIDSSSPCYKFNLSMQDNPEVIIFDTSCILPNDLNFIKTIDYSITMNIPLIIIRSHIKLDNFSTEYARLGSILFLPNRSGFDNERFIDVLKNSIGFCGHNFFPQNLYPWLGNSTFFDINQEKQDRVMHFCQTVHREMVNYSPLMRSNLLSHENNQYFTIRLPHYEGDPKLLAKRIAREAHEHHLPIKATPSFGLNFVAIDGFPWYLDHNTKHLRIAASDLPIHYANMIGSFIANKVEKYVYAKST